MSMFNPTFFKVTEMSSFSLSLCKSGLDLKIRTRSSHYNSMFPLENFSNRMFNVQAKQFTRLHPIETSHNNAKHIRTFLLYSCNFFVEEELFS